MKIIFSNLRKGEVKVLVDSLDDLWYLSHVIDAGDTAKAKTLRKIKVGGTEENPKYVRKPVTISIKVEKLDFSNEQNTLRVSGTIIEGPEDVPRGSHHSFGVDEGSTITIIKEQWLSYQLQKLEEATEKVSEKVLICVMDREEVYFALLRKKGYEILSTFKGDVAKKDMEQAKAGTFYSEIIKQIQGYVERYQITSIVIASPGFFKEDLMKEVKDSELKKKITLATCNAVGKNAIDEVLKRPELKEVLRKDRVSREIALVDELFSEISQNNLAAYGIEEVKNAVAAGAVKKLLVTDGLLKKKKEINEYPEIDGMMRAAEQMKGEVFLINSEHDGGKRLDGIGGIGAVLRYKINY